MKRALFILAFVALAHVSLGSSQVRPSGVGGVTPTSSDAFENKTIDGDLNTVMHIPASAITGNTVLTLTDPNADRMLIWNDATNTFEWLTLGAGLSFTGSSPNKTLNASGSGGTTVSATVRNSANIPIPHNTPTVLTFDTEAEDNTAGIFDSDAPDRFTVLSDGLYLITAQVAFAGNATGTRSIYLIVDPDGAARTLEVGKVNLTEGSACYTKIGKIETLAAGDEVQLSAFQTSGVTLDALAGNSYSLVFTITKFQ